MRSLHENNTRHSTILATLGKTFFLVPVLAFAFTANVSAQDLLNPLQVFEAGVDCPADHPDAPNNFVCTSNDIKLDIVELTGLQACIEGEFNTAEFNIDLEVNANIRYNPMVWISENAIDPRVTGSVCYVSSVPDGPLTHIPELIFSDANQCADVDVPSNAFTLANLEIGEVTFLCTDTDGDGMAEIPIMVTWNNSGGAECAQGTYPINETPSKCDAFTAETEIIVQENPGIQLTKLGTLNDDDGTAGVSAGDTIDYAFTVENTGDIILTNVTLTDPDLTSVSGGPIASLGIGETDTTTFTGSYVITQADIDFDSFTNTATVNTTQDVSDTGTFIQPLEQIPALTLLKSGALNDDDGTAGVSAGDSITYAFTVTNSGNLTLTNITISDPDATISGGPLSTLAPGNSDTTTFTGSYIISQLDIDAGTFTNTATAISVEGAQDDDSDTQPLQQDPELTLVKTASPPTYNAVSQQISYQFRFTNSGNVTLSAPFTVADDIATNESCPATPTSLAPGEFIDCTATYNITQADIDAGSVTNTASGTAQDPNGQTVTSNNDQETVTAVPTGTLVLVKTATPQTYNAIGDVISYSYLLTNGMNITLHAPYAITDDKSTDESCPATPASLAPGDTVTCTASYTITQIDLDAGSVTNAATGTANDPGGQTITSNEDTETVNVAITGSLTLVKTATPQTYTAVGDVISYSYLLTNNLNVPLYPPYTMADDKSTDESCPAVPATLAPAASVTCTASYTISQADLDAGSVTNAATGTAQDAATNGQTVTSNEDTETVNVVGTGSLTLVKTATPQTYTAVGDVISYSYLLTNNRNTTLYPPYTMTDDKSTDESCPAAPASLAPAASVTCTASYTIVQADLTAGSVTNAATGTAQDAASNGQTVTSNEDTETVNVTTTGSLALVKTASPQTYTAVGDVISYSYLLTNNLNVPLYSPYTMTDDKSTDESCPAAPASLAPGESVTCTASYTIVQADLTAGSVTNLATGTAQDAASDGQTVTSNQDSETVNAVLVNLAKSAAAPSFDSVSGRYTVVYTITASNSGTAAGSYDLTDTFTLATGITLFSAEIAYAGGETQTGTPAGPLPHSFTSGDTVVTGEGLGGGATESWTVTAVFDVDPTLIDDDARSCVEDQEQAGQGFYNMVTGVTSEADTTDNDACVNLPDPSIDLVKTAGTASFLGDNTFKVIYTVTANNLGDGPGYYDLTDTIDPGNGITVSQALLNTYNAGTEDSQSGTLAGAMPYVFTSPATLVTGEALAAGRNESWTIEVDFVVSLDQVDDTFECSDVNGGAGTGFYNLIEGSDSDPDQDNNHACTDPTGGDARFTVTKDFTDDNPMGVVVNIVCNTGLPLHQSKEITEFDGGVTFVVTNNVAGDMDCDIFESTVEDYLADYTAGSGASGLAESITDDENGCHYENIFGGTFSCEITNDPDASTVTVHKRWIVENGEDFPLRSIITIWCDAFFDGAELDGDSGNWFDSFELTGDGDPSVKVYPDYPSSTCWAKEEVFESYVGVDNQCDSMTVSVGDNEECYIYNTVFTEGIPTLNRYGLALMALLMLGIGAVGFRRFI